MNRTMKLTCALCLAVISCCFFAFGVYAASTVTHTTDGTVNFTVKDVFVDITMSVKVLKKEKGGIGAGANISSIKDTVLADQSNLESAKDASNNIIAPIEYKSYNPSTMVPVEENESFNIDIDFNQSTIWIFTIEMESVNNLGVDYYVECIANGYENGYGAGSDVSIGTFDKTGSFSTTKTVKVYASLENKLSSLTGNTYSITLKMGKAK